jgi:NADPH2:quinone reductase
MRALAFDRFGDPSVLSLRQLPDPVPAPGEALVRTEAIGLNFADVYRRKGNYHLVGAPPWILGYEAAGVIEAVSPGGPAGLPPFRVGDRVAFADVPRANAELVAAPLTHLVPLPEGITAEQAAALLLQGLTAHYLIADSHALRAGELAVVHAAAGGVGLLLVQLARLRGATVFALTSSAAKAARARAAGAHHVATYAEDWAERVRAASRDGQGADVVFDSVGSTLQNSLAAVRKRGHVVFYGMAGGDPAPVDPRLLMDGSKSLTGGDLWNVLTSSAERVRRSGELFGLVAGGQLVLEVARRFPLAEGAEAHRFLESRASMGKVLLLAR